MFNKYYEDELAFLRELGAEFARANPAAAPYLAERGGDPDVERLLEGVAFLTGRLRQKLDDELPELTQSLMQMLWPHYLRPIPSMSILQFDPVPGLAREAQVIPRGTEIDSVPVDGTECRFRTCWDVTLLPLSVESLEAEQPAGTSGFLRLRLRLGQGVDPVQLVFDRIRLHLQGEPSLCHDLFLQLSRRLRRLVVRAGDGGGASGEVALPPEKVRPAGLADEQALLPYPAHSFPGYRLLQEYFALPQKFLFLDVENLPPLSELGVQGTLELLFEFAQAPEAALRVAAENVRLHCTPVVNLFGAESDPLRVDHQKVQYLLRPSADNPAHLEVFSVDRVKGWVRGTVAETEYPSFHSFRQGRGSEDGSGKVYYYTRLREAVIGAGVDTYISFVDADEERTFPETETVIAELTCTNRNLAKGLRIGDIRQATGNTPGFAKFRNIAPVTEAVTPPLRGDLHWRMLSNLSLNYLSLTSVEALRSLLDVYNFQALYSRQAARENELRLKGIVSVQASPEERIFRGSPVRGTRIEMEMKEENFGGEGGMVLFAGVLNEFLSLYCTVNSFTHLIVRGSQHGEVYEWKPKSGPHKLE